MVQDSTPRRSATRLSGTDREIASGTFVTEREKPNTRTPRFGGVFYWGRRFCGSEGGRTAPVPRDFNFLVSPLRNGAG
jgi:hypothetical protein